MEYKIKSDTFELADIFECGQCFRWNKEENGSYTGVFHKNVLNVDKKDDEVIFKGICEGNIEKICTNYKRKRKNSKSISSKWRIKKRRYLWLEWNYTY